MAKFRGTFARFLESLKISRWISIIKIQILFCFWSHSFPSYRSDTILSEFPYKESLFHINMCARTHMYAHLFAKNRF